MKNTFKYIAFGIALLASSFALNAQTYHREGGMATSKTVTGPENGYYTISLESFATGETTVTETATPVDIVLVLDVSGSMNRNYSTFTYNARNSQGYSYSSYSNNTYYYKHTDGKYYEVERSRPYEQVGYNYSRRYRLSYQANGTTYYLSGTGTTTTPPTNVTNENTTIWTGVLYTRTATSTTTRIAALKSAVEKFVNAVKKNATEDSKGQPRRVDNQISIVKYAGHGNNNPAYYDGNGQYEPSDGGNHRNGDGYNYTEVVMGLTSVLDGGDADLITAVKGLNEGGATASNGGMQLAINVISHIDSERESNKVVVLFTDGEPTYSSGFSNTVARGTVANAYTLKNTYGATVYTIGVFDNETTQIRNYMTYTSSNYPQATGPNDNGNYTPGNGSDKGFYQNASDANLDDIFEDIAHASAAADAQAGASTQVRDVISNSFIMPADNIAQITMQISEITEDGLGWGEPYDAPSTVTYSRKTVTTTTGEEHEELVVQGFDYTAPDTYDDDGFTTEAGNWVGLRYSDATSTYWAGKKLIISFKIKANEEATGGDGTATNHPDSGVYVQEFDKDGNPVLDENGQPKYNKVNQYDVPHTPLPLLIRISKSGLRKGESATFQLMRIRPLGWNDEGATLEEKMAGVQYNAIGKPMPGIHEFDPVKYDRNGNPTSERLDPNDPMDYLEGIGWIDWSKVILTNKTADKTAVIKSLYGLDPGWVYMIVEDDWAWSYQLTGSASSETTSSVEVNPFSFENTPRTVNLNGDPIVKHAESVTINHFKTLEQGSTSREEHYKSSKTNFESR